MTLPTGTAAARSLCFSTDETDKAAAFVDTRLELAARQRRVAALNDIAPHVSLIHGPDRPHPPLARAGLQRSSEFRIDRIGVPAARFPSGRRVHELELGHAQAPEVAATRRINPVWRGQISATDRPITCPA